MKCLSKLELKGIEQPEFPTEYRGISAIAIAVTFGFGHYAAGDLKGEDKSRMDEIVSPIINEFRNHNSGLANEVAKGQFSELINNMNEFNINGDEALSLFLCYLSRKHLSEGADPLMLHNFLPLKITPLGFPIRSATYRLLAEELFDVKKGELFFDSVPRELRKYAEDYCELYNSGKR